MDNWYWVSRPFPTKESLDITPCSPATTSTLKFGYVPLTMAAPVPVIATIWSGAVFVITSLVILISAPAVYIVSVDVIVTSPNPVAGSKVILLPAIKDVTPPCDVEFIVTIPVPSTGDIDISLPATICVTPESEDISKVGYVPVTVVSPLPVITTVWSGAVFVIVELPVAPLIDIPVPAILDNTPVLFIIGLSGSVLFTDIPVPELTEVTVPPPAGVAHWLSPLKKFCEVGVPVADKAALIWTSPFKADIGVRSIKVVLAVETVVTGVDHVLSPLKYVELPALPEADKAAVIITLPLDVVVGPTFINVELAANMLFTGVDHLLSPLK